MATARVRTPRRRREWIDSSVFSIAVPVNSAAQFDLLNLYRNAVFGPNTRTGTFGAFRFTGRVLLSGTPSTIAAVQIGICKVGISDIAGVVPNTQPYRDWMYFSTFWNDAESVADATIKLAGVNKSMRKVSDPGETIVLGVSAINQGGTLNMHLRAIWMPS